MSFQIKSKFNNLYINGIRTKNCDDIKRSLSVAMKKAHAPEKLHLQFVGKMDATMIEMTVDYKESITSLGISAKDNEDLLLQPSFIFKSLAGFYLNLFGCTDETMVRVCEAMLVKHANNLKNLVVIHLKKNLTVPNLPKLNALALEYVNEEAAWNILEHCRPTITSLDVLMTDMISPLLDSNSSPYEIANLNHLRLSRSNAFNFVLFNAEHLVSLELRVWGLVHISEDFVWPQFPNLRELKIDDSKCLPILMNSRETLEHLFISSILSSNGDYASVVIPRLTDLQLLRVNDTFIHKICNSNHISLEFMHLRGTEIPKLYDGTKMERIRNVVLESDALKSLTAQDRERMSEICPNAEVVIMDWENRKEIGDQIRSRFKSRNFKLKHYEYTFL